VAIGGAFWVAIRGDTATIEQLVVLSNLESFNSELIKEGLDADTRLKLFQNSCGCPIWR